MEWPKWTALVLTGTFSLEILAGTFVFKKQDYIKPEHIHPNTEITWVAEKPKVAIGSGSTSLAIFASDSIAVGTTFTVSST